ncbi:MAG TPA: type 1 glutamine amidotransferase [Jatrophihabitans sp.]|jgi:GMP synthase-like glutamine amidotransferase
MEEQSASAAVAAPAILVIENGLDAPVARLGDWLRAAGAELVIVNGAAGHAIPESLSEYRGLVVMGGSPNAYDDATAPWLPQVRTLLAESVRRELPTLGVCLGGQLLAAATGGRVERAETPEYGAHLIAKRQAAAEDPLFKDLPITPDVLQWHVDEITSLPPGAVQLASSPAVDIQAFRIGRCAWGVQFHIETTPEIVELWADEDAAQLADYDVATILQRAEAAHPDFAEVWQPVATSFVGVVADPDGVLPPRRLPMAGGQPASQSTAGPITDPAQIRAALAAEMQAARGTNQH